MLKTIGTMTMKSMIAGVALAAVMACAGGAQAAPLVIDFTIDGTNLQTFGTAPYGITKADFPASGSATLDLTGTGVTVQDFSLTIGGMVFDEGEFSEASSFSALGVDYYALNSKIDPDLPSTLYDIVFSISATPDAFSSFFIELPNGTVSCTACVTASIAGGVMPVPLPSSAPLFGTVVLALGAAGYGFRRSKAA